MSKIRITEVSFSNIELLLGCWWQNPNPSAFTICSHLSTISHSFLWSHLCNGLVPWGIKVLRSSYEILSVHLGTEITCQTVGCVTSKISWTKCISILWLIKGKAGGTWVERHRQLPYGKVFYSSIGTVPHEVFMAYRNRVIHFLFSSACSRTL